MQSLGDQIAWVKSQSDRVLDNSAASGGQVSRDAIHIGLCILWAANMIVDKMEEIRREGD